jgi:hypothetical protein
MPKTGDFFIDAFSAACIFFPLLPVIIIFLKRDYSKEVLNFLMILCLLNFIKGILLLIPGLVPINQITITNIFSLPELLILVQIFRSVFFGKLKHVLTIFLVAFLSSVITYYLMNGVGQKRLALEELQDGVIVLIAIFGLSELVRNDDLQIFQLPLFWIAIGTIFYFAISVLVRAAGQSSSTPLNQPSNTDTQVILDIACMARYFFYMLAALFYQRPDRHIERENSSH